jgi:23S rRNA pseudouridine2605 synthase
MEKVGHPVLKLKRIAFGPLRLGRLARASYRLLTPPEMAALRQVVGLK